MFYLPFVTRDPNDDARQSRWPIYTVTEQKYLPLNNKPLQNLQGIRVQTCTFWNRFLPKLLNITGMDFYRVVEFGLCF